ncbi:MAG: Txe/YoeB family addiction module toxin [Cloacibacillus sp.]
MNEPWKILYTKQGLKDKRTATAAGYGEKISELIALLKHDPFEPYPPYEKLVGDLKGGYSRRINIQHRLVYQVYAKERTVKILSLWEHYE